MNGLAPEDILRASHEISIENGALDYPPIGQAYGDPRVGAAAQAEYNTRGYAVSDDVTNNVTVADYFSGERGVHAWTAYRGNTLYIHPGRLNTADGARNQAFITHELLHNAWGLDDTDIQRKLGITVDGRNTGNITNWFKNNCVTGNGNR